MFDTKHFTQQLKNLRKVHGLTQQSISEALDISLRQYQNLELGKSEPSFGFVLKLNKVLKVPLNYFNPIVEDDWCPYLDNLHDAIQISNTKAVITYGNTSYAELIGRTKKEFFGKSFFDFNAHQEGVEDLRTYLDYLIEKKPIPSPYVGVIKHKNGHNIEVEINWNYLFSPVGDILGFFSILRKRN